MGYPYAPHGRLTLIQTQCKVAATDVLSTVLMAVGCVIILYLVLPFFLFSFLSFLTLL